MPSITGWKGVVFTDSGGFQVMNPNLCLDLNNEGIVFRSPYDGQKHLLTPERSVIMQQQLGSDVAMLLDDCPPFGSSTERIHDSVERTLAWAKIFREHHQDTRQQVFAIVQGGLDATLRKRCATALSIFDFDGYAIGGLSLGEPFDVMMTMSSISIDPLPPGKASIFDGFGFPP